VPKLKERKMLIKKVHGDIGHFGKMRTLVEIKIIIFSGMTELSLLRPLSRIVRNVRWLENPKT
jgi:hypothetical protein